MVWLILLMFLLAFQLSVLFLGAPYVPTRHKQRELALDMLGLKPGQTLIDLGCGDGAMLIAAAKRGINSVGYEINPVLAMIAWLRTRRYGKRVKIVQGNFWRKKWPKADGVFVFLTQRYMKRLHQNMHTRFRKPVKLITYGFCLPDKKPSAKKKPASCINIPATDLDTTTYP